MGKTADTTLRIRAKNLASKDLRDVSKELDALADSQKKNATAADLAARSLAELTAEQKTLAAVSKELQRRGGLIGNLQSQKADLDALKTKIAGARTELERLKGVQARGGFGTEGISKQIARVVKDIKQLENKNASIGRSFTKNAEAAAKIGINLQGADAALAQINKEAARTEGLMVESAAAVTRYNTALTESRGALAAQEAVQREITAEALRRNQIETQAAAQRRAEAAQRAAELREQARIREDLTKRFLAKAAPPTASPLFAPADRGTAEALGRENAFRERLVNVLRRQRDGGAKLLQMDGQLAAKTREVTAALDRQAHSLDRNNKLGGIFADTGRKSLSVYQRLRGQILSTVAAYVGLYQAASLVKQAITVQQERRKIGIQLQTGNGGDVVAAARDAKFLREEADRLGLVFEDVAKNFANYKIAAKSVGASNRTIRETFSQATEIVTGLALSADDADGVFRAFVQILGKARVQAEELRGQLGDRLPGAVAAFAKTLIDTGKIKAFSDLDSYLKKGKANVQDFFNFLETYSKTTQGAVDANSKSLFAQFNRLTNAWRDFLAEFANNGVSKELLDVVNKLIEKLKGNEGAKFGKDLAAAFVLIGKGVLWVIENFDLFVKLVKAFLILNLAKAAVGIASSFLVSGKRIYDAGKAFVAFTAATNAARIAGGKLTFGMRAMTALAGPLGIALGALAVLFYRLEKAEMAATQRTDEFIERMRAARGAQGAAINGVVQDNRQAAEDTLRQIHETQAKLEAAKKLRDEAFLGVLGDKMETVNDSFRDQKLSVEALSAQLAELKVQHQGYVASVINGSKRAIAFAEQEKAAREADANSKDNFVNPTPGGDEDKGAAAALKAAEVLAEKKHDLADRANKALLSLDEDLAQARIDTEIGTQEQIDANLKASLAAISADVAKRKVELEGILHDAQRIGAGDAAKSATLALDKLPALQKELELRAKNKAITDSLAMQEAKVNSLIAERDNQIELINAKVQLGILSEVEGRQQVVDKQAEYRDRIQETSQGIIDFLTQLAANPETSDLAKIMHIDELIAKFETVKLKAAETVTTIQLIGKNLGGQFSQGVASFFSTFIKGATGGIEGVKGIAGAFKNAMASFQEFLANFLVGIGEAILQAILLEAIMAAIEKRPANFSGAALGAVTGHTGGVVRADGIGSGNPIRQVSAAMFMGAQRFHGGGLPGLKAGEVPAILKTGEEVLTEDDPRNVLNGGAGGGGGSQAPMDLTVINAVDSASVFAAGAKRVGRKVVYNVIQGDIAGFKRLLGIP